MSRLHRPALFFASTTLLLSALLAMPTLLAQQKPEPDRPAHFVVPDDPEADFVRREVEIPMRDGSSCIRSSWCRRAPIARRCCSRARPTTPTA